jgi:glycosyltransferase involved in cell wall biosynthesis
VLSLLDNNIVNAPEYDAMVKIRRYRYLSLHDALYLLRCAFANPRWSALLLRAFLRLLPRDPKTAFQIMCLAPKLIGFANECKGCNVLHVHSHFGGLAAHCGAIVAAMIGKKFSFMFHTIPEMEYPCFDEHLRQASSVLVNSENNFRVCQARFGNLVMNKMGLVRSVFGLEEFRVSESPNLQQDIDVISVGRLWPKKGFDTLLEALVQLRANGLSVNCVIIGDGPDRQRLQNFILDHDLSHCSLAGSISHDQIKSILLRARIFVLPCKHVFSNGNLADEDGLPVAITEALASGLPVISCDVGGIGEVVIDSRTGFIVPQNDPKALAATMEHLLTNENLRSEMSNNAVALIRNKYDKSDAMNTLLAAFGIDDPIPNNRADQKDA